MTQVFLVLTIVAILAMSQGVSAKRGCAAYGHSCFGGHGKRSGNTAPLDMSNQESVVSRQLGQEELPPHPGYPRAVYNMLQPGDDFIPIRDGGVYERFDEPAAREVMNFKLRNIFKHWMDNNRRSQQNNDESSYMENF